jgi:hypothetical protein
MGARWDPSSLIVGPQPVPPPAPRSDQASRPPGLDPYFRWAVYTDWRGFARLARWELLAPDQRLLQIIARAPDGAGMETVFGDSTLRDGVAPAYKTPLPGKRTPARHFTAQLTQAEAGWLWRNPLNLRWKLAMPLRDARTVAEASPKGLFGPFRDGVSMQARNVVAGAVAAVPPERRGASSRLDGGIAVIDFACPFLHDHLGRAGGTRVRALWDQGSDPGEGLPNSQPAEWPWQQPARFLLGREMGGATMDAVWRATRRLGGPDESLVYRGLDHLIDYQDPRRRVWQATHGGHVLDVAGGILDPLTGDVDPASSAELIFVQLPSLTATDSAGGSLGAHILDGIRYAMARVPNGKPLVVVVSYGNSAGPHDGTSLIESAMEELLRQRPDNFAIVLAAGNARQERNHARRSVRQDRSVLLRVQLADGDTTDTFIEAWYPANCPALEARVRGPDRVWSEWIGQGQEQLLRADTSDGEVLALVRHDHDVPNGDGAMVLVAFAPTAQPPGVACSLVDAGQWDIEFRLADPEPGVVVTFDAWIERDDPSANAPGWHSYFIDQTDADEFNTLSSIAGGAGTLKAFGCNRASGCPAPYSSLPARERECLGLMAVCEDDELHPTVAAAATRSDETYRMRGTSVAAPVLARRLFAIMAATPGGVKRWQWKDILAQLAEDGAGGTVRPFSVD